MSKEKPTPKIHKDMLRTVIKIGDIVAYPDCGRIRLGTVTKLNPQMLNIQQVRPSKYGPGKPDRKYPSDVLIVDDAKITLYMLSM